MLPWIHLFADESGVTWPCCRTVGEGAPNRGDDGEPRRVHDPEGLRAAMNTAPMRALRREMLEGTRPAACARCFMVEDLGITSHRQDENAAWREEIPALVAATGPDGSIAAELRTADLRLGNVCNLRCRMCSPQSTRALLPEWATYHGVPLRHPYFDRFRGVDWFEDPAFWQLVEEEAPGLQRINFAGGEPFLIDGMFDFLERLVASGRAPMMTISYNTNLTVLPPRLLALWPRFGSIRVTASIDGVGAVHELIRHPSKWEDVRDNLLFLDRRASALKLGLATNTAVQACNVFGLGRLLAFLTGELARFEVPNLTIVTHPAHLDVRVLPAALKAEATRVLDAVVADQSSRWRDRWGDEGCGRLRRAIAGICTHMNEADATALLPEFRRWSTFLDESRGQSTAAAVPELASLFTDP